jgi:hypothetical protein
MATKSKLEQAVERQASSLNDAQRELTLSQFSDFKRNKSRIAQIEDVMRMMDANPAQDGDVARRMQLASERAQLIEANNSLASNLFAQLGDKEGR